MSHGVGLITGVSGFVGRHVACVLADNGWSLVRPASGPPENAPLYIFDTYESVTFPASQLGKVLRRRRPDVCVHSAGRASENVSMREPRSDFHGSVAVTADLRNGGPSRHPTTASSTCRAPRCTASRRRFADAVLRLAGFPDGRAALGREARKLYERCFEWTRIAGTVLEALTPSPAKPRR